MDDEPTRWSLQPCGGGFPRRFARNYSTALNKSAVSLNAPGGQLALGPATARHP